MKSRFREIVAVAELVSPLFGVARCRSIKSSAWFATLVRSGATQFSAGRQVTGTLPSPDTAYSACGGLGGPLCEWIVRPVLERNGRHNGSERAGVDFRSWPNPDLGAPPQNPALAAWQGNWG